MYIAHVLRNGAPTNTILTVITLLYDISFLFAGGFSLLFFLFFFFPHSFRREPDLGDGD
jgi:hypothetical protein